MKNSKLKKLILSIAFAVTAVVFLSAEAALAGPTYFITGDVTNFNVLPYQPVEGVQIWISYDGSKLDYYPAITGADGKFSFNFSFSQSRTIYVIPVKSGYSFRGREFTGSKAGYGQFVYFIDAAVSQTYIGFDATRYYTISGHLGHNDGRDIVNATVSVGGNNVQTDGFGNYTLNNVPTGSGWFVNPPLGYSWTPTGYTNITLPPDATGKNFTASQHGIYGSVKNYLNQGIEEGVTVTATSAYHSRSDRTYAAGVYGIGQLYSNEPYTVTVEVAGHSFTPQQVTIGDHEEHGINFRSYAISGHVRENGINGTGIDNATITISGDWNGTVSTGVGNNGNYIKSGLASGNYNVSATATGYILDPSSQSANISTSNVSRNFYTYIINGYVRRYSRDGTGVGINGIKVKIKKDGSLIDTLTTHDRDGDPTDPGYYEKRVGGGTYTIEAENPTSP